VERKLLADPANLLAVHRKLFPVRASVPADVTDEDETLEVQDELVELFEVRSVRPHTEITAARAKTRVKTA
jgi:hypothetical protein